MRAVDGETDLRRSVSSRVARHRVIAGLASGVNAARDAFSRVHVAQPNRARTAAARLRGRRVRLRVRTSVFFDPITAVRASRRSSSSSGAASGNGFRRVDNVTQNASFSKLVWSNAHLTKLWSCTIYI